MRAAVVTVWRIPLDPTSPPAATEVARLSGEERARAARFRFDRDRHRWLGAHVAMRRILAGHLGVAPEAIRYALGPRGKPALAEPRDTTLAFNLSDSDDQALLALTQGTPLGVDLEHVRPLDDLDGVARSHFAPEERRALFALPEAERLDGFYRLWTRKEAFIKAVGTGLGFGLERFAVTLEPVRPRLLHVDGDTAAADRWCIVDIAIEGPFIGALAIERPAVELHRRDWVW